METRTINIPTSAVSFCASIALATLTAAYKGAIAMSMIHFEGLPLPHYIHSGSSVAGPGRKHPERYAMGEFDLLVVKQGCMYIGEADRHYEVSEGHALILRPDQHHYPTEGCREQTSSYWLHFHTLGSWFVMNHASNEKPAPFERAVSNDAADAVDSSAAAGRSFRVPQLELRIPQFTRIAEPGVMYDTLQKLILLERDNHLDEVRWRQQLLFHEALQQLAASVTVRVPKAPAAEAADSAVSYLREHYRNRITAEELGAAVNFHPVYIARCMQRQYNCSPMEYLLRYRLEQAKHLLLQTDLAVHQIAEEVGFQQAAYFTACFRKQEGCTPRDYRCRAAQLWGCPKSS